MSSLILRQCQVAWLEGYLEALFAHCDTETHEEFAEILNDALVNYKPEDISMLPRYYCTEHDCAKTFMQDSKGRRSWKCTECGREDNEPKLM